MAKRAGTRMQALVTVAGTVAFVGACSAVPRLSLTRTEDSTIVKYDHVKPKVHVPAPADPGLVITSGPKQPSSSPSPSTPAGHRKPFSDTDWILDTGATTHVCTNRALLHSYDTLNPYSNSLNPRAVGYFGPNPVPIVGAGDCTLSLPSRITQKTGGSADTPGLVVNRMTIRHVMHIPSAGVNLISWSQLKRAKGLDLNLVEDADGSLSVRNRGQLLMQFEARDGLFFLVQLPPKLPGSYGVDG
ncbi:hypothetical protein LTR46_006695 [Exophiala xenobiotica]|nr:hypothetical protein LTR46_006695 [Exophiala xenobiotica]